MSTSGTFRSRRVSNFQASIPTQIETLMRLAILRISVLIFAFALGAISPKVFHLAETQYHWRARKAREAKLREDLFQLRAHIKTFSQDKGGPPNFLDDLVYAGYLREIPTDPFTGAKYWNLVTIGPAIEGPCAVFPETVISASNELSTEGTPYNRW